jgi:multidrug efflux pump subunit AcrA (membrane-fusion protein)
MHLIEPNQPETEELGEVRSTEERLRKENEELRQQLRELSPHPVAVAKPPHPSSAVIWMIAIGIVVLIAVGFYVGYMPRFRRDSTMLAESREQGVALPLVNVIKVVRSSGTSELILSGNIQPVTEAPILARADGYIRKRLVDIGDRVKAGQAMAEIEAPELDHQVSQARAAVRQTQAALDQAQANYNQGKANEELAGVTAQRWKNLASKGVVSRQENDQYQSQYQAQIANLDALDKGITSARSNVSSANANLDRLIE